MGGTSHTQYFQQSCPILEKKNLAKNCYSFTLHCEKIAAIAEAGQFAHIKAGGFSLRRPISICEIDKKASTLRLVFEVRGEGTERIATLNKGDLMDIIAPLGRGFTLLAKQKRIVAIGGGIGVPPMLEVCKHYEQNATAIIGFRSSSAVILHEDFLTHRVDTRLCTDDGTAGQRGYVSEALETRLLEKERPDMIYACGPHAMLGAVISLAKKYNIPCEVSLEERMGCGVGACLVCACKAVKDGKEYYAHVCKDGPVFNAEDIVL